MDTETTYETERTDHLGIVAGICREISLVEQIDGRVGRSERKVSNGQYEEGLGSQCNQEFSKSRP